MSIFHLKYRPKKVFELDLPEVVKTISLILASKERARSYLFAGPKGAGKTSAARIMAKAVNCLKPDGVEPCDKCDNCKDVVSGSSIDIIEIDGASNRGIDDVRVLKERAYLLPSKLGVKVFIIDEVHMLTKEAFNALLKLVEEPPKHTLFIMCTTDPQKIPDTMLSRLLRVDFRRGRRPELLGSLDRVIKAEGIKMPTKARELIVSRSDGSFRNLHKMLNEIFMEFGKKISLIKVMGYFADRIGVYSGWELEKDLMTGEAKVILQKLEKLAEKGIDFVALRCEYLAYFQERLLASFGIGEKKAGLGSGQLREFLALLVAAGRVERDVDIVQLPLELAVVELLDQVAPVLTKGSNEGFVAIDKTVVMDRPEVKTESKKEKVEKKEVSLAAVKKKEVVKKKGKKNEGMTLDRVESKWVEVLAAVKPFNHSVEAFMRSARPKVIEGEFLVIEVFYPFHKEKLEEDKNRKIVEQGLAKVFDCQLLLKCVLSEAKKKAVVIGNDQVEKKASDQAKVEGGVDDGDIYDVAKEIFG